MGRMKKEVKDRFIEIILESLRKLPMYPDLYRSTTTLLAEYIDKHHDAELRKLGIYLDPMEPAPLLRQLNNLHRQGKVRKQSVRGRGSYRQIFWGKHAIKNDPVSESLTKDESL